MPNAKTVRKERPAPTLGRRIKSVRALRGWNQADLAEAAGISCTSVCSIETGRTEPKLATLKAIARVLDVTLDELTSFERGEQSAAA